MSYASYGSEFLEQRASYGVTLVSQVTGQFFSGELRVVTQVTSVLPVTEVSFWSKGQVTELC